MNILKLTQAETEEINRLAFIAVDAIAQICGTEWVLPGQVVRAVEALAAERDRLRGLVQAVADAEASMQKCDNGVYEEAMAEVELERAVTACFEEAKRWEK